MKKTRSSPMRPKLNDLRAAFARANDILAKLWAKTLMVAGSGPHGIKPIGAEDWDRCVKDWYEEQLKVRGEDAKSDVTSLKGNLVKALSRDSLTWSNFYQGLQILTAGRRFKAVRFEVHLIPTKESDETRIVAIDVINRETATVEDPLIKSLREGNTPTLKPGETAMPDTLYIVEGFNNPRFQCVGMRYTGWEPMVLTADYFDGMTFSNTLVQDADGMIDTRWQRLMVRQ